MTLTRRMVIASAIALAAASAAVVPALAQYPDRPITFIIPYGPGGGTDISGRALAVELEKLLGQPVVVENVEGGGGAVGLTGLYNADPDGYTIGVGTGSNTTIAPHATDVGYDPLKFSYVASYYGWPYMALVNPSVPATNLEELAAWAKANPGALINSTSGGYGIHDVAMALFSQAVGGIDYRTLPNNSAAETTTRILAGDANLTFGSPATNMEHVQAGSMKALGVVSDVSVPALDEMKLEKSQDALGFALINRTVVLAPPGLPEDIRVKLEEAVATAVKAPEVIKQLDQLGLPILYKPGAEALTETTETFNTYGTIIADLMKKNSQ